MGSRDGRVNQWDDQMGDYNEYDDANGNPAPRQQYGYPQQQPFHNQYPGNRGGYGYPQQPQQGYYQQQQHNQYGPGIPMPPPPPPHNRGVPINYNQDMGHEYGATAHFKPALNTNSSPVVPLSARAGHSKCDQRY